MTFSTIISAVPKVVNSSSISSSPSRVSVLSGRYFVRLSSTWTQLRDTAQKAEATRKRKKIILRLSTIKADSLSIKEV